MTDQLTEIARRLERQPWNRPGSKKSWVLNAMWQQILLMRVVRRKRSG